MAGNPYLWSLTPGNNQNSDSDINWAEGQVPGSVNGSARAMMSGIAGWLKDTNGTLATTGSLNAYAVASNVPYAALATGIRLVVKANHTNTAPAVLVLTPSGGSAFASKAIRVMTVTGDAPLSANQIINGGLYELVYNTAANGGAGAWILLTPTTAGVGLIYYVRSDGSDSNTGLADTAGAAFLTLQKAWDTLVQFNLGGNIATINIAAGTYTAGLRDLNKHLVGGIALIVGAGATTVIAASSGDCFEMADSSIIIRSMKLSNSGGSAIHAYRGGVINIDTGIEFGVCSESHCFADNEGQIIGSASYSVSGNAPLHWFAHTGGLITVTGRTVTHTGTPAYATAFAYALRGGIIECGGNTYTGAATGNRFFVDDGGVIYTGSTTLTELPGNAGSAADIIGGFYGGNLLGAARLLAGDGAVGAPALSWSADPDCGWYRVGANNPAFAVNGAKVLDLATTGLDVTGRIGADTISGNLPATQAEQETGTATDKVVTPGRQHFHASACKCWAAWGITDNLLASYNVTSVTDSGTGTGTLVIGTDFSSTSWGMLQGVVRSASVDNGHPVGRAAGSFTYESRDTTGTLHDPVGYNFTGMGDLS